MVEINPFCQKVLKKNFPNAELFSDIYEFKAEEYKGTIDIITGGFPCQPFSVAGQRKGTGDDRYLWPEMYRVIREVEPPWLIIENVPGLLSISDGMVFDNLLSDLGAAGYETQTFIISAAGVGAPHLRNRIWIVAYANVKQLRNEHGENKGREIREGVGHNGNGLRVNSAQCDSVTPDFDNTGNRTPRNRIERQQAESKEREYAQPKCYGYSEIDSDTNGKRQQERRSAKPKKTKYNSSEFINSNAESTIGEQPLPTRTGGAGYSDDSWSENWLTVATRLCRMDDGISAGLDRANRIKALGNAIVPQIAYQFFKAIINYERERNENNT
jgi:DNA (cytosine-5)-methyltransferase 1